MGRSAKYCCTLHDGTWLPLQSTLGIRFQFGLGCAVEDSRIAKKTHY